jgi:hypothetical protein
VPVQKCSKLNKFKNYSRHTTKRAYSTLPVLLPLLCKAKAKVRK